MKRVGFILAFIATKLFWTLSWCKTVSNYSTLGTNPCLRALALYFGSRGEFCGPTPYKWWFSLAEAIWKSQWESRSASAASAWFSLGPGRLSNTSKIFVQQDSNLRNPASCWFRAWLCQPASPDYPQIKSFRLYINRHKILKRSNTGSINLFLQLHKNSSCLIAIFRAQTIRIWTLRQTTFSGRSQKSWATWWDS